MPILVCAVLSLALAWARGASPLQLGAVRVRWLALPLAAFAVQGVAFVRLGEAAAPFALWIQLAAGGMLLAFLLGNLRFRTLAVVAAGAALNLVVIAANGGYMPVRIADLERAGFPQIAERLAATGRFQKSSALDDSTRLPWLADVIHVPLPGPDRMMSVGDVAVALGTFLFVQEALVRRRTGHGRARAAEARGDGVRWLYCEHLALEPLAGRPARG